MKTEIQKDWKRESVRLPPDLVKLIDEDIAAGIYKSRAEACVSLIRKHYQSS